MEGGGYFNSKERRKGVDVLIVGEEEGGGGFKFLQIANFNIIKEKLRYAKQALAWFLRSYGRAIDPELCGEARGITSVKCG